ncbi:unnamed protein product [Anisakis simplex]|uniref:Non-specific serine/threonine protein kinase n=1 Tax=Anisakis simplex TaxID=6269 RepID=A0A0M3JW88_ANISI|nr:unnamed protein product [Anisakis simplex]
MLCRAVRFIDGNSIELIKIRDGRLALVGGNPAELIGYWNRNEIDEVNFGQNVMHFNGVDCRAEDMGIFALICGQIQPLAHFFSLSMRPGSLISYLNRKTADGAWMNTIPTGKLNTSSHLITSTDVNPHPLISNHVTERSFSSFPSAILSRKGSSSPSSALKNCITYVNISGGNTVTTKANCGIRRAASDMPYYMNVNNDSSHYNSFSTARHLSASSIAMNGGLHSSLRSTASERCSASALIPTSRAGAVETVLDEDCKTATSTGALATVNENRGAGKYVRQLQKTTRNRGRDAADFKDKSRLSQHQRSRSVGLEASVKRSGSTREENWDRAKRIIGGVRKSVNRNAMMIHVLSNANALEVSSSHAVEELPKLDVSVCNADNTPNNVASTVSLQGSSSIPGLIKLPPERFALKKMGNIFTKNLRKSITGSYSKYDGERATHHYNPGNAAAESPLPAVFDCLESAVNKGRARLIEADRRNSSFAEGLHSTAVKSSMQMQPRRYTLSSKACASGQPYQMSSAAVEKLESNADSHHPPANTCYYSPLQKTNPNINDKPPPLPPRTYLKNKVRLKQLRQSQQKVNDEATVRSKTDESVNLPSQSTTSVNTSTVRRPLQGSYCTVVSPSSNNNTRLSISANTSSSVRPSSQKSAPISSIHQAHTVYTQIDPIATMAATQTQADMMKERERHVPQQQRLITQSVYASDRSLGSRSKRNINSDDRTNSISTKRFFSKHIWRKPSKSHSHSDLRF